MGMKYRILKWFDYVYYRAYLWYKNKNEPHYHFAGIAIVAVLIVIFLISLLTALTLFFFTMPKIEKWETAFFAFVILLLVRYRYTKLVNFEDLHKEWEKESKKVKTKKGWLIIFVFVSSMMFTILIGYLRHNLGLEI